MGETARTLTFRRWNILIQPAYQVRMAVAVLGCIIGYSLLLGVLIFYPLQQQLAASASPEQQFQLARQTLELHARLWPGVLVVAILVAVQSLFVTHRVVGPAYHLRRVMEELAAGNFGIRVHLRRGDRLKELEAALNALAESLQRREQARADRVTRLEASLVALNQAVGTVSAAPALRRALEEVERVAKESTDAR